ncbi:TonB-dependent siderophore receptor [Bdellovibrio sp. KM01]|uniref:TonB-dependent siderophore receptor n=1 Tax=Bdellovibrio sp. KM01 TaxID=2748865 RepID=UPI0015E9DB2F|nr:TonB-dependent receptor plug domain-containing protein [Bdellovibrio sp. KM01]QLY26727.1 TonB-dependent receptor plug domain-containing protein [Bdellovibrio sp. KM01]
MKIPVLLVSAILGGLSFEARGQESSAAIQLQTVLVNETADTDASVLGFPGFSLQEIPLSASSYDEGELQKNRIHRLSDLTTLDASLTDSYNATGYWDMVSIRGYTLDNRNNFRREGLPINAETSIPLDNKANVQVLKGLSGVQAGISAPGGMINYLVKRPTEKRFINLRSDVSDSGDFLVSADAGGASAENLSYRVNVAQEYLSPHLDNAKGSRTLLAGAVSYRLFNASLLDLELEWSQRSQPSQAGMSLLGASLPAVSDPNINLNNQSWSQPVEFTALTGTLRYSQTFAENLNWVTSLGGQSLLSGDHLAYPFGCTKEGNFDRYCSDGTFDFYDFRSDDEKRDTLALRTSLDGKLQAGALVHSWNLGIMGWKSKERYQKQAYNFVGEGKVDGSAVVPADPSLTDESTNRDSDNLQIFVSDSIQRDKWTGWLGGSWNGIERSTVRTDGSRPTNYYQSFVLPWAALSYQFEQLMAYASYAEGMESFVTPNRNTYTRPGEFLADVKSHQYEIGLRGGRDIRWGSVLFEIHRPVVIDQAPLYQVDGSDVHRGIEVDLLQDLQRWSWNFSSLLLETKREGSAVNPVLNGKKAVNVPEATARLRVQYHLVSVTGMSIGGRMVYEGPRAVLPDNSIMLPGWVRWDAGVSLQKNWGSIPVKAEVLVENLLDRKYWRESPTQYGHVYLYPGAERLFTLSFLAEI